MGNNVQGTLALHLNTILIIHNMCMPSVCVWFCACACGVQKRASDQLYLELQAVLSTGAKVKLSIGVLHVPKC